MQIMMYRIPDLLTQPSAFYQILQMILQNVNIWEPFYKGIWE